MANTQERVGFDTDQGMEIPGPRNGYFSCWPAHLFGTAAHPSTACRLCRSACTKIIQGTFYSNAFLALCR
jgi:hypothetical protein